MQIALPDVGRRDLIQRVKDPNRNKYLTLPYFMLGHWFFQPLD
jgi:hypothetical protein